MFKVEMSTPEQQEDCFNKSHAKRHYDPNLTEKNMYFHIIYNSNI